MKLAVVFLILFGTLSLVALQRKNFPMIEVALKIRGFDAELIQAETQVHQRLSFPRKAIQKNEIDTSKFKVYQISLLDWITANEPKAAKK